MNSKQSNTKEEFVELKGFYITPMRQKSINYNNKIIKSQTINFDEITKILKDFLNNYEILHYGIKYKFTIKTADESFENQYLDKHIKKLIDESDFIIVDWTSQNPNVLLEAGYAFGRGKVGISLIQEGHEKPPSDLSGLIYCTYRINNKEELIGLKQGIINQVSELIKNVLKSHRVFVSYNRRPVGLFSNLMQNSKKIIAILQTNLETINANHINDLQTALRNNVKVKILTLDPQSRYVNERALQLEYKVNNIGVYRNSLQVAVDNIATTLCSEKNFSLKLYNDFPNQLTYRFDDNILVSMISRTNRSRNNCTFHIPNCHVPGPKETFLDHFDQLWRSSDSRDVCK